MVEGMCVETCPEWAEISQPRTISQMMERLSHAETTRVIAHFWQGKAFITLGDNDGNASFINMPERNWQAILHMIYTNPMQCPCWACDWRVKRRRYNDLSKYEHLR